MDHLADIDAYVRDHQKEMVSFLEQLVCTESPTHDQNGQQQVQDILGGAFQNLGFRVVFVPGRKMNGVHLFARPLFHNGSKAQLLMGHCDTVWPAGTLDTMPFRVEGNEIRGPGVYDMKGGLVQGLFALRALYALKLQPAILPVFFVNSDEEVGSPDSSRYIRMLARRVCRVFVLEPALGLSGKLKTARKGAGRFNIRITGRSAHAGLNPREGASAIVELSHVIQKLHALNDMERGITVNVGQIEGGVRPNVVAPTSSAVVDVRVQTMEDGREVEAAIYRLSTITPGTELVIEGHIGRPPLEPTKRNRALWRIAQQVGHRMGIALEEGVAGGVSDGNTTSQYTATLDGMGAVGDGAHAPHEYLYIDKMIERTVLLAMLLMSAATETPATAISYSLTDTLPTGGPS